MGFGANGAFWKKKLEEWAPEAWYYLDDAPVADFEVVIEDIMLKRFRGANSKMELELIWSTYADDVFKEFPNATEFIVLFDEDHNLIPKAKWPEQKDRSRAYKGLTEEHFKDYRAGGLGNAVYLCHPDSTKNAIFERVFGKPLLSLVDEEQQQSSKEPATPFQTFLSLYHNTPKLRKDFISFVSQCMSEPHDPTQPTFDGPGCKTVRIDRGFFNDERKEILVEYQRGERRMITLEPEAYIPGESDLKLGQYLREHKGKGVWIRCADMDVLPIVLLSMKDLIDKRTGNVEGQVFVDLTPLNQYTTSAVRQRTNIKQVVDMVALWKMIHRQMKALYAIDHYPVETLCAFMILCGTDFVRKPPKLAMGTLWPAFASGGHVFLSSCIRTDAIFGEEKWQPHNQTDRYLSLDEVSLLNFYRYAYTFMKNKKALMAVSPSAFCTREENHRILLGKCLSFEDIAKRYSPVPPRKRKRVTEGPVDGGDVQPSPSSSLEAEGGEGEEEKQKEQQQPLNEFQARAEARRVLWNAFYWYSGHAIEPPNPVKLHPLDGSSMYGWQEEGASREVVAATSVCSTQSFRVEKAHKSHKRPKVRHPTVPAAVVAE